MSAVRRSLQSSGALLEKSSALNMKAVAKKGSFEADLAMFSLFHSPRSEIKAESHDFYRVRSFIIITIQTDLDFSISSLLV